MVEAVENSRSTIKGVALWTAVRYQAVCNFPPQAILRIGPSLHFVSDSRTTQKSS